MAAAMRSFKSEVLRLLGLGQLRTARRPLRAPAHGLRRLHAVGPRRARASGSRSISNPGHAYMKVAGLRFDTSMTKGTGPGLEQADALGRGLPQTSQGTLLSRPVHTEPPPLPRAAPVSGHSAKAPACGRGFRPLTAASGRASCPSAGRPPDWLCYSFSEGARLRSRLAQVEDTAAITVDDRGSGQPAESAAPSEGAPAEPPDVRLSGLRKMLRRRRRGGRSRPRDPPRRVLHPARALRLRQDDHAADDRRLRGARRGLGRACRTRRQRPAPVRPRGQHRVPGLRPVPAHDRGR